MYTRSAVNAGECLPSFCEQKEARPGSANVPCASIGVGLGSGIGLRLIGI
jgi:hypothetical protein